ncbi:LytTR family DNA-binding domain-containing protein [Clostridium sp. JN-9]|uniref:LytR/AlgR family response regulator transcription factor n=1 Tax=Clostridium sp. JN-9 TaxID=2507159 RepID=UPI000FFE1BF0|nr:LytTR family DNA-binding domain-containing protein [Clostridium sp. JN-9]QAT41119.1 response regulator transcription factor [Clostridium sp. JN-9]
MNSLTAVIIEDEIISASELEYILHKFPSIIVKGLAYNCTDGYKLINKIRPDVVFTDINMPKCSGIELAEKIKFYYKNTYIVFVTAYNEYAVKAFEIGAADYILKPYDEKRIQITIERLLSGAVREKKCDKLCALSHGKTMLININEVYYCFAENEKNYIKTKNKKYITNNTLSEIEAKTNFFRCHKSFLVNIDNVKELFPWFNGTYKLIMKDDESSEITVSRNNVKKLKELLEL